MAEDQALSLLHAPVVVFDAAVLHVVPVVRLQVEHISHRSIRDEFRGLLERRRVPHLVMDTEHQAGMCLQVLAQLDGFRMAGDHGFFNQDMLPASRLKMVSADGVVGVEMETASTRCTSSRMSSTCSTPSRSTAGRLMSKTTILPTACFGGISGLGAACASEPDDTDIDISFLAQLFCCGSRSRQHPGGYRGKVEHPRCPSNPCEEFAGRLTALEMAAAIAAAETASATRPQGGSVSTNSLRSPTGVVMTGHRSLTASENTTGMLSIRDGITT